MRAVWAKQHVQNSAVVVEHPHHPLEGCQELDFCTGDMLPDVRHRFQCGRLKVLILRQILIYGLGCAPRYRKDGDTLGAPRISLIAIGGKAEGLDRCNQLWGDVDVGLVGAQRNRLEPFPKDPAQCLRRAPFCIHIQVYLLCRELVGMHNPRTGLEDPFLRCSELGFLVPAFCSQRLGGRSLECDEVCMVCIGLGQLGVCLGLEDGGYERREVQTPWHWCHWRRVWCRSVVGTGVGGWGVGPAVPPTVPPAFVTVFLPRWPAKQVVKPGGWLRCCPGRGRLGCSWLVALPGRGGHREGSFAVGDSFPG